MPWAPGGETLSYKAKVSLSAKKQEWAWYIRKHPSTLRVSGEYEREPMSLAATVPFDDCFRQSASLQDCSLRLMREFLAEVGSELGSEAEDLTVEALERRTNIVGGPIEAVFSKNVGLLFFNEHPEQFSPVTQIDVVYFPDGAGGDRFEEKEFRGPLGRIARDAVDYIARKYLYEVLVARDKSSLDVFWLKDKSLTDLDNLQEPDDLAEEFIENLEAGLISFREVLVGLNK